MNPYITHTSEDQKLMLKAIGVESIEELFECIPDKVLLKEPVQVGQWMSEHEVVEHIEALAERNVKGVSFLGEGSYDHIIPAAVKAITALPSFVTAYTPYQPEISQGVLQGIFEYQSMICSLTGMDVSNASLYDGASAAAEAAALGISNRRKSNEIVVSSTMHPFAISCVETWAKGRGHVVNVVPEKDGQTDLCAVNDVLNPATAIVIVQSPNKYGIIEDYTGLADKVHDAGALLAIEADPLSLALQKSQAEWGADIAIGDTQVFGIPMGFGGPYCGYMAVKQPLMRKIPGRIVGRTVDTHGDTCYVLTLQAREQHIKRERATSNICSNEALMALASAVHLSLLGWNGVREVAEQCYAKSHYLADGLSRIDGISLAYDKPFWCEFSLRFDDPSKLDGLVAKLLEHDVFAGVKLSEMTRNEKDEGILVVAVTEKRTKQQMDFYIETARRFMA